ncbi:MAG: dihydroorotase [Lachnospiraceae bacterium]|nr:dihydroorotase [Lachnospiraceae bacterium]
MLIKNGTILSPGSREEYRADLRITDGKIAEIAVPGAALDAQDGEEVIDASSCVVAPGLIDVHVHFRDPGFTYKEDLHTGACAAAAGGFTTVVCMANTKPAVDNPETLNDLVSRAKKEDIRIRFAAAITKNLRGQELTEFEQLVSLGACGFTDDGIPLTDAKLVETAMRRAKALGLPLSFHEEDPAFIEKAGTNRTAPAIAENILVARDCMLSRYTGAVIDIQHISSARSVDLVRAEKDLGTPVFVEATPHHFSLTEEAVEKYGTFAKMNPPLRTEADRQAIIAGLQDGTIDIIATDHAPHSTEEKSREDFFAAPSGIIGLETSLALGITSLVRPGHLTLMQLLEKMTVNPARLYRIDSQARPGSTPYSGTDPEAYGITTPGSSKPIPAPVLNDRDLLYGSIRPGSVADLVIFNPDETFVAGNYQSKSENTPFTGMELYGKIHCTICDGHIIKW